VVPVRQVGDHPRDGAERDVVHVQGSAFRHVPDELEIRNLSTG
jgi:hypothetical protein